MKSWDAVVIGGGVIGLSIALELNKRGHRVLVVDRSEPGREASHAAGGMLAHCDPHTKELLRPLASASAHIYHEFVHELQDETGVQVDFRGDGSIVFPEPGETPSCGEALGEDALAKLEPQLVPPGPAYLLPESSVDPRRLVAALIKSIHHRQVDLASGAAVVEVEMSGRKVTAVRTEKSRYVTSVAINCAGAWAARIAPVPLRARPVKGQMLSVVPHHGAPHFSLRHVVRRKACYLIPRNDGKVVIGSTVEEAGYDKRVDSEVIHKLHQEATILLPDLGEGRILEAWAGLRPATPDELPLVGETSYGGYLVATGHYRDGILLAPITAKIIAQLVDGESVEMNLIPFSPERFV